MLGKALKTIRLLYGYTIWQVTNETLINSNEISLIEREKLIPTEYHLDKLKKLYKLTGIKEVLKKYKFTNQFKLKKNSDEVKKILEIVNILLNHKDVDNTPIKVKETKLKIKAE